MNISTSDPIALCSGVLPDFTTSSFNSPFTTVDTNTAPCNGLTNSYTYSTSGGALLLKESTEAISSFGCTSNTANITINIGTHGGTFTAWKTGAQYYTVVANFTYNDLENQGTYCASGGSPEAYAWITAATAMFDDTTAAGVGFSSNGGGHVNIVATCNISAPSQLTNFNVQASFTTSTTINNGDQLIPRGSVTATVFVSMPSTYPASSHSYSNIDFDNDGYGDITLNSLWVH